MTWTSPIPPGMLVIDDNNYQSVTGGVIVNGETKSFGLIPRDFARTPYGSSPAAPAWPDGFLMSDDELIAAFKLQEETQSSIRHLWLNQGYVSLDQNGTNYCWNFGCVSAVMADRAKEGYPYTPLSPASAACRIKGFRNEGGWGLEAIEFSEEHGWCSQDLWPQAAINRKYLTDEAKANALTNRIKGWWDVPSNLRAVLSCTARRMPCPVAFNWWGHLVCATGGKYFGPNDWGLEILNSWGVGWSDRGFGILRGSKAQPDDAQCIVGSTVK